MCSIWSSQAASDLQLSQAGAGISGEGRRLNTRESTHSPGSTEFPRVPRRRIWTLVLEKNLRLGYNRHSMKIAVGADHRGYRAKESLKRRLQEAGHEVVDCGAHDDIRSDHPIFAYRVARAIVEDRAERGILVCGTGVGMEIAANKVPGIRAVLSYNPEVTRLGRSHNDANVMTLSGDHCSDEEMWAMAETFLSTEFLGGRYQDRVSMYHELEEKGYLDNGSENSAGTDPCTTQ